VETNYEVPARATLTDSALKAKDPAKRPMVYVATSSMLTLTRSTVQDFRDIGVSTQIVPANEGAVVLQDSRFVRMEYGIVTFDRHNVRVTGNLFLGVANPVITEGSPTIEGNTFVGCLTAIEIYNQGKPTVSDNTVTGCQCGIVQRHGDDTPQEIHGNDLFGNDRFADQGAPTGDAYFRGNGEGNWWSADPPDPARVQVTDVTPWRASPVHPERLPMPVLDAPADAEPHSRSMRPAASRAAPSASPSPSSRGTSATARSPAGPASPTPTQRPATTPSGSPSPTPTASAGAPR
jgi:parallel beta-helix repeat protein